MYMYKCRSYNYYIILQAYPSLKSLPSWVADLVERIKFIQKWIDEGIPPVSIWLSYNRFTKLIFISVFSMYRHFGYLDSSSLKLSSLELYRIMQEKLLYQLILYHLISKCVTFHENKCTCICTCNIVHVTLYMYLCVVLILLSCTLQSYTVLTVVPLLLLLSIVIKFIFPITYRYWKKVFLN